MKWFLLIIAIVFTSIVAVGLKFGTIYAGCMLIVWVGIGFLFGYLSERKDWNNGKCRECNTDWQQFDVDSQGGRGYFCSCGKRHSTWISYSVDKVKP